MKKLRSSPVSFVRRLTRLRKLAADRRAMAAVEFGMLLPVMLLMFFGTVELSQGFAANRKLTYLGRDLADITSQSTVTLNSTASDSSNINTIFAIAASVLYPFQNPQMALTGIVFLTGRSEE